MSLAHFSILIHGLLTKDPDTILEKAPLIRLDRNYALCMGSNGNDTNHSRHIYRRVYLLLNGDDFNINNIYWCEGGLILVDLATNNYGKEKCKYHN